MRILSPRWEANHEDTYGKPGAPIVPMQGEERQYFYFPHYYDFLHLSVGDWRSIQFLRELLERLKPDVVHFHHYHRVGVESIRAARLAAPDALISFTFHEMMAICMADGQMVKKGSRDLCHAASPVACNKCFPELRPEFVHAARGAAEGGAERMRYLRFPVRVYCRTLCRLGATRAEVRGDPERPGQSRCRFRSRPAFAAGQPVRLLWPVYRQQGGRRHSRRAAHPGP